MDRPMFACASLALWLAALPGYAQSRDEIEGELARETKLALVERVALAQHPALAEAQARAAATRERAFGAGRLADPEFKYEQWAVPLKRPYALGRADTLMFGLRQALPAPGARAAQARIAEQEVALAAQQRAILARDLVLRVRRAYFDYCAAARALAVHAEHLKLAEQIVQQVRSDYEVGRGNQQDVLKVLLEQSQLHNELAETRQEHASSRLMLNTLMARAPDAPLGPPAELALPLEIPGTAQLDQLRGRTRPELAASGRTIRRAQASLDAAQIAARRPSFMIGADYWLMPSQDAPHAYGAMVAMSLPWLSAGRRADVREAEQLLSAERHAARALDDATRFELYDALARLEAARTSLTLIEGSVLPQAEQSLSATRSAFAAGRTNLLSLLDSLRAYFQIRLEHSRASSRLLAQLATLEFASGASLFSPSVAEGQP